MALKVIGTGFGRTGTLSLKKALEQLGFGPCHHMAEVRDNPAQLPFWQQAAHGEKVKSVNKVYMEEHVLDYVQMALVLSFNPVFLAP